MDLEFKRFQKEHYAEYASWFSDPELNRHLGPMDLTWLEAVLSQPESQGVTWAVLEGQALVSIVETVLDKENHLPAAVTALATKPTLRQRGIGTTVLQMVLKRHKNVGISEHVAYISADNEAGRRCAVNAGFVAVTFQPDERGYIEFRHYQ
jgi:RimJ/RimL family protein N-acetyltransferase